MTENRNADQAFVRHRGPVTCVVAIPGSQAAVSSAYDGSVAWADLDAGTMELLGYHDHIVNRVTVHPEGHLAATTSSDYNIYLWDLAQRKRTLVLRGHSDDVEDFAFVDDATGISVSRDWRILVWNLETGAIRRIIEGHEKDVLSVVYSNGQVYTSGDDMTLRVWDLDTGHLIKMWGPFENETDSCAIDALHGRAVLGCDDGVIRVFDIESSETVAEIPAHASGIKKVATSPVTGDILSAAYDQRIIIWNADDFTKQVELERRATTWERSFNWSPDGKQVVAGTFDGTILVWDAATGKCLGEVGKRETGNACLNEVSANDRGQIATVSDDGFVRIGQLKPTEAQWVDCIEPTSGCMLANAITLDDPSASLITGTHDQKLRFFEPVGETFRERTEVLLSEGPINCVRVAHQQAFAGQVFVACYSGSIARVDQDGTVVQVANIHEGAVKALRLHPTLPIGVSCSADGTTHSWDFEGNVLRRFIGHMAIVDDVDIDPAGKQIVSVSRDFTARVYDLESGLMRDSLSLGRRSPKAVCFYDSDCVIVTNYWGSLLRFDLTSGKMISQCIAENGISSIARCGTYLVASSYDGGAYLVDPQDLSVLNVLRCMTQRLQPSELIQPVAVRVPHPA